MFPDRLIVPEEPGTDGSPDTVTFRIRLPWYRALPMDGLRLAGVEIDGQAVSSDRLDVQIDGVWTPLEAVPALRDTSWFVLDPLRVRARGVRPASAGDRTVSVTVGIRVPYIMIGNAALVVSETLTRTLPRHERNAA